MPIRIILGYVELAGVAVIGALTTSGVYLLIPNTIVYSIISFLFALVAARNVIKILELKEFWYIISAAFISITVYVCTHALSIYFHVLLPLIKEEKTVSNLLDIILRAWGQGFILFVLLISSIYILDYFLGLIARYQASQEDKG